MALSLYSNGNKLERVDDETLITSFEILKNNCNYNRANGFYCSECPFNYGEMECKVQDFFRGNL